MHDIRREEAAPDIEIESGPVLEQWLAQEPAPDAWSAQETAQDLCAVSECCSMPLQDLSQPQQASLQRGPQLSICSNSMSMNSGYRCLMCMNKSLNTRLRCSSSACYNNRHLPWPQRRPGLDIAAAPARASPIYNDRRDLEAMSTAPSRKSSAAESGGSRDLSGLTQRDPVPLSIYIARAS